MMRTDSTEKTGIETSAAQCRRTRRQFSLYLDGALTGAQMLRAAGASFRLRILQSGISGAAADAAVVGRHETAEAAGGSGIAACA